MLRKRILAAATLLVLGITTLHHAAAPSIASRAAAPVTRLTQVSDAPFTVPMDVRTFGLNPRAWLYVLDERAEGLLDN